MRATLDYYGDLARASSGIGLGAFAEMFLNAYIHCDNNHAILLLPAMMMIVREYHMLAIVNRLDKWRAKVGAQ